MAKEKKKSDQKRKAWCPDSQNKIPFLSIKILKRQNGGNLFTISIFSKFWKKICCKKKACVKKILNIDVDAARN